MERRLEGYDLTESLMLLSKKVPMPQEVKDFIEEIENMERVDYR